MISTASIEMANLLDSVENSVWHAFEYMALEGDGTVPKSKLKVGKKDYKLKATYTYTGLTAYSDLK